MVELERKTSSLSIMISQISVLNLWWQHQMRHIRLWNAAFSLAQLEWFDGLMLRYATSLKATISKMQQTSSFTEWNETKKKTVQNLNNSSISLCSVELIQGDWRLKRNTLGAFLSHVSYHTSLSHCRTKIDGIPCIARWLGERMSKRT